MSEIEHMTVQAAAALLEVHANTVRNWMKSGLLPDHRAPGMAFARLHREDVLWMRDAMRETRGEVEYSWEYGVMTDEVGWVPARSRHDGHALQRRRVIKGVPIWLLDDEQE